MSSPFASGFPTGPSTGVLPHHVSFAGQKKAHAAQQTRTTWDSLNAERQDQFTGKRSQANKAINPLVGLVDSALSLLG